MKSTPLDGFKKHNELLYREVPPLRIEYEKIFGERPPPYYVGCAYVLTEYINLLREAVRTHKPMEQRRHSIEEDNIRYDMEQAKRIPTPPQTPLEKEIKSLSEQYEKVIGKKLVEYSYLDLNYTMDEYLAIVREAIRTKQAAKLRQNQVEMDFDIYFGKVLDEIIPLEGDYKRLFNQDPPKGYAREAEDGYVLDEYIDFLKEAVRTKKPGKYEINKFIISPEYDTWMQETIYPIIATYQKLFDETPIYYPRVFEHYSKDEYVSILENAIKNKTPAKFKLNTHRLREIK